MKVPVCAFSLGAGFLVVEMMGLVHNEYAVRELLKEKRLASFFIHFLGELVVGVKADVKKIKHGGP
jgi:hypothetical protein